MLFQLRTDNHIANSAELQESVRAEVEGALTRRHGDRLQRIEVYLQDTNGHKGGVDTRCAMEAHLAGLPPIAVDDHAASAEQAVTGAVDKLLRALEHRLGRIDDRSGHTSASGLET